MEGGSVISVAFMFSKAVTSGGRWQYYDFYSIHVQSNLPKIGRQCTPPPRNRNLPIQMEGEIARLAAWWKMLFL